MREPETKGKIFKNFNIKDALTTQFIIDSFRQVITASNLSICLEAFLEEEIEHLEDEYTGLLSWRSYMPPLRRCQGLGILAAVMELILTMVRMVRC
ncbi:hypothetical protein OK016_27395 [Vibrio chagasii]|nr:hypothetical protein [Vibrio chagasii]